jgi:hypothetical protein
LLPSRTGIPVAAFSECRDPNAPLAESAYARVSETRCSGFESRVGHQIFSRERKLAPLFYNLDVANDPAARNVPSVGPWAARRGGGLAPAIYDVPVV